MTRFLRRAVRKVLDAESTTFNVIAWAYGTLAGRRATRRAALIRLLKDGRFDESELWMASGRPSHLLDAVVARWKPRTFLDVGCGVGSAMEHVMASGIDCHGIEGSAAAVAASHVKKHITLANLNNPVDLHRQFDVVWSYEVAEHIHPNYVASFLDTLTNHGDKVVLSASRPGQGGAGHFNEQLPGYWIGHLRSRGFQFQEEFSSFLQTLPDDHAGNVMAFTRNRKEFTPGPNAAEHS